MFWNERSFFYCIQPIKTSGRGVYSVPGTVLGTGGTAGMIGCGPAPDLLGEREKMHKSAEMT